MDTISKLAELFAQFPGIGTRQSKRFVYFLLKRDRAYISELVKLIGDLQNAISECARCHRYFMQKHASAILCSVCGSEARDHTILMIVEKDSDMEAIERSGIYLGTYFVLGGTLPILEKEPEKRIRVRELRDLLQKESMELKEVILACAVTPESEHTAEYVRGVIAPITDAHLITVTTLGRGLSTGTELEYSDSETIRYALSGRK